LFEATGFLVHFFTCYERNPKETRSF